MAKQAMPIGTVAAVMAPQLATLGTPVKSYIYHVYLTGDNGLVFRYGSYYIKEVAVTQARTVGGSVTAEQVIADFG
jgi:hypothetical protein